MDKKVRANISFVVSSKYKKTSTLNKVSSRVIFLLDRFIASLAKSNIRSLFEGVDIDRTRLR